MRLLHASDFLLGNPNYRSIVQQANGIDLVELDRRAAFDRAVGCALKQDVDTFLISGGLFDKNAIVDNYVDWLNERCVQLQSAEITPVFFDPENRLDGVQINALVFDGDSIPYVEADITFVALPFAKKYAQDHPDRVIVAVGHGAIAKVGGKATYDHTLDDRLVVDTQDTASYIALGGMLGCQPLTPNAWMCGAACALFRYHTGNPGALLVQLGLSTRQLLDLVHVSFESRRRVSINLDAGNMTVEQLAGALHMMLDQQCWQVDSHTPLDAEHPLAKLYGSTSSPNKVGWWSRPILSIAVVHAEHTLADIFKENPLLRHMLSNGEHLLAVVEWNQENVGATQHKFAPHRRSYVIGR